MLQRTTEDQLNTVLDFYDCHGVSFSRVPTVEYRDTPHPVYPHVVGQVGSIEERGRYAYNELLGTFFAKNLFRSIFNLHLSDAAFEDKVAREENPGSSSAEASTSQPDIVLYKPYRQLQEAHQREILAHEVFHVVDDERRLVEPYIFTIEGAAVYAQSFYSDFSRFTPPAECNSLDEFMYRGGAHICNEILERNYSPGESRLAALLIDRNRFEIQECLRASLSDDFCARLLKDRVSSPEHLSSLRKTLPQDPFYSSLLTGSITRERILENFRTRGAATMADEMERQDMGTFLAFLQSLKPSGTTPNN